MNQETIDQIKERYWKEKQGWQNGILVWLFSMIILTYATLKYSQKVAYATMTINALMILAIMRLQAKAKQKEKNK